MTERDATTLALAGDVMIGRGMDQALGSSVDPGLEERFVKDARRYLELAERASGPIPEPVPPDYPWGDALEVLERADPDARIVNLETALTARGRPWAGKGIHYRSHPDNVAVLRAAGVDACSLANNHAMDWGPRGLLDTLEALEGAGVTVAGAGRDAEAARAPAAVETGDGRRILLFGLGSPTAGVPRDWAAGQDRPGVRLLDEVSGEAAGRVARRIRAVRGEDDLVVVSIHWGGNWGYRVPGRQRRFARRLVEEGAADLVHGHSAHHPKGVELHRGRPILYGCGDLINDYEGIGGHEEYRPELVLLWLAALERGSGRARVEMIPMRTRRFRLERADDRAAAWLAETLDRESRELGTRVEVEAGPALVARPR